MLDTCQVALGLGHFLKETRRLALAQLGFFPFKNEDLEWKSLTQLDDPEGNEVGSGPQERSHQSLKQTHLGGFPWLTTAPPLFHSTPDPRPSPCRGDPTR